MDGWTDLNAIETILFVAFHPVIVLWCAANGPPASDPFYWLLDV